MSFSFFHQHKKRLKCNAAMHLLAKHRPPCPLRWPQFNNRSMASGRSFTSRQTLLNGFAKSLYLLYFFQFLTLAHCKASSCFICFILVFLAFLARSRCTFLNYSADLPKGKAAKRSETHLLCVCENFLLFEAKHLVFVRLSSFKFQPCSRCLQSFHSRKLWPCLQEHKEILVSLCM